MSTTESEEIVAEGNGQTTDEGGVEESLEIEVEGTTEGDGDADTSLEARVAQLEAEKKENFDRFVRTAADLENLRKRSRRDVQDARLDERGKILNDMLPVIDDLERAVQHAETSGGDQVQSLLEGVKLVLRSFQTALSRHNVKAIEAIGKPFDPARHEAVSQAPSSEHPPGTVISVLRTGYTMEERLLRPALAVVSIAAPTEGEDTGE